MMKRLLGIALLAMVSTCSLAEEQQHDHLAHVTVDTPYELVREGLELAITGRGLVINNVAHIGDMLSRTGEDVGAEQGAIYEQAEAVEFCSATVSRDTMAADPHNIVFCPYVIAVYVTADDPETTHIAYRRPTLVGDEASRKSLEAVDQLLGEIVEEAAAF